MMMIRNEERKTTYAVLVFLLVIAIVGKHQLPVQ